MTTAAPLSASWDSLADAMYGDEPDYDTEPVELPGADDANRALGRKEQIVREWVTDAEIAEAQIEQVRAWLAGRAAVHAKKVAYLDEQLASYHAAVLRLDPKRKTISLPNGQLVARQGQARWEYTDPDAFIAWALRNGKDDIVRTYEPVTPAPQIDKNAVKQALVVRDERERPLKLGVDPTTNEIPPGLVVHDADTEYKAITETELPDHASE